jgi:RNA polymerase sigma factor (sigma-70 family)
MKSREQSTSQSNLNTHWRRFLTGDREAFGQLMSVHYRSLFQYGSKFSKDKEFVKDSIQDLFLTLWEKRENLSADAEPKPYMMASLRRLMHRSTSSRLRLGEGQLNDVDASFDVEFSVEHAYIENESTLVSAQQLHQLLDELPKRQKEVVYLKYFQEMDRDQISEVMAVTPQTVSNLLQIAIKQLKKHWRVTLFLAFDFFFSVA